jgi:hypothetical protein
MVLLTPFEETGAATSAAAEVAFYDALATDTGRISRWNMGLTSTGGTMWLVCVGVNPPTNPEPAESLLLIAKQHGNETATREVAIQSIRDFAYLSDPDDVDYLTDHPVYIIPTVNYRATANNENNVNLNRDHVILSQPETKMVHDVLNLVDPVMAIDLHENMSRSSPNAELMYSSHDSLTETIQARSQALVTAVGTHLTLAGISWGYYTVSAEDPSTSRNALGYRHIVTMLSETMGTVAIANRVSYGVEIVRAARNYHLANHAAIVADVAASRAEALATAADRGNSFTFDQTAVRYPLPEGYIVSAADYVTWQPIMDRLGITSVADGSDRYVTMVQEAYGLAALLMDPLSPYGGFDGTVDDDPPYVPPGGITWGNATTWGPIRLESTEHEVTSVALQVDGELRTIWTPTP